MRPLGTATSTQPLGGLNGTSCAPAARGANTAQVAASAIIVRLIDSRSKILVMSRLSARQSCPIGSNAHSSPTPAYPGSETAQYTPKDARCNCAIILRNEGSEASVSGSTFVIEHRTHNDETSSTVLPTRSLRPTHASSSNAVSPPTTTFGLKRRASTGCPHSSA